MIPSTWHLVPRTVAGVKAKAKAVKKTNPGLATAFTNLVTYEPENITGFTLQAFLYSAGAYPEPEVLVNAVKTSKSYGAKDLTTLGDYFANEMSGTKGSKVTVPKTVTLPAAKASLIESTVPDGDVTIGRELYLIPDGKRVFEIEFVIDASYLSKATIFDSIARTFQFA